MPEKAQVNTFFCTHCGETKTYKKSDPRVIKTQCDNCLQGEMIEAAHATAEPDATE
jgi:hypothetical protein